MPVSFSLSGGSFLITDSVAGITYSSNNPLRFLIVNNTIQVIASNLGGSGNPAVIGSYALSDITTIGGNPVAGTLAGAVAQLNTLTISALPAGAATSALQATGNATLVSILNKQPEPTTLDSITAINAAALNVRPYEFALLVAQGRIQGHSWVPKAGKKPTINQGTGLTQDIWGADGAYTGFPTGSPEIVQAFSSSASDTGTLTIVYLATDTSTSYQQASVVLQGTTHVDFAVSAYRIHTAFYSTGGSTTFNVGTITVRHKVTTANVFLSMNPGTSQTYNAGYTIPFNSTGYLYDIEVSIEDGATGTVEGAMWIRLSGASPRLRRNFVAAQGANYQTNLVGAFVLPALTDIQMRITACSANNTIVLGGYNLLIVQNT